MSHTPGPWTLEELDDTPGFLIVGLDGQPVARVVRICFDLEKTRSWQPGVEADAHLIAAAPDMLCRLLEAIPLLEAGGWQLMADLCKNVVRRAGTDWDKMVAKAEGW